MAAGSGSRSSPAAFAFGPVPHSDASAGGQVDSSVSTPACRRQVPLNEVAFEFDPPAPGPRRAGGWGNVTTSRQAHDGTVVTDGLNPSPGVQYGYADGAVRRGGES